MLRDGALHVEKRDFSLGTPFFCGRGKLGFLTLKPSFPDFGDLDPCKSGKKKAHKQKNFLAGDPSGHRGVSLPGGQGSKFYTILGTQGT